MRVLNFETGEEISLAQYRGGIADLRWSYDGRYLAAGTDRLIQVWDVEEQELVQSINVGSEVLALDWGRTSHVLASGSYRGIIDLWSAVPGENILRIAGHTRAVKALAWSPQGDYLASGGEEGTIRIWDLQIRKERMQLRPSHSGPLEVLAWSPDGTHLASGGHDFLVRLWNMTGDGEYVGAFTERIKKPFVHSRGFEFGGWAKIRQPRRHSLLHKLGARWQAACQCQLGPDRCHLGCSYQNPTCRHPEPSGLADYRCLVSRGDQVAFGGYDQAVHVYSGTTGEEIKRLQGHNGWVQSLAWSPDGKHLASSGYDRKIYIWDLETDRVERTLSGDDSVVTVVEWSPCGRYLAGGSHSGTVRIWDVKTGEVLYTYPGQELGLQSLAWSPAGDQLAITEYNSIIILGELD